MTNSARALKTLALLSRRLVDWLNTPATITTWIVGLTIAIVAGSMVRQWTS
jgi:uncharacterized membrane protein